MDQNSDSVPAVADVNAATPPAPGAEDQKPIPPAGEAPAEAAEETTEQKEAREKSKFARRIDRQKAAKVEAQTEARLLREQNAALQAKLDGQSKPQQDGEPQRESFEDYESYTRALARWEAKQATAETLKTERDAQAGRERQQQATAGSEKQAKAWAEREATFQAATKDYEAVVAPFADEELQTLSGPARMAIVDSDVGPALLYHLAKHPEIADKIADLSPVRQIAELGKLEATLSKPAARTTNAPDPIKPVGARASGQKDLEKMSQAEYEAERKARGARYG